VGSGASGSTHNQSSSKPSGNFNVDAGAGSLVEVLGEAFGPEFNGASVFINIFQANQAVSALVVGTTPLHPIEGFLGS